MSEGTGEGTQGAQENGATGNETPKTFTQDEVNQLVGQARTDERRKVQSKFSDYDEVKAKADGARTLEERIADLEAQGSKSEQRALRAEIAAEFGISTKRGPKTAEHPDGAPSDADLFLTGTDGATLRSQAQRLAQREADRKQQGNVVPNEGGNTDPGDANGDDRAFVRGLFGRAD